MTPSSLSSVQLSDVPSSKRWLIRIMRIWPLGKDEQILVWTELRRDLGETTALTLMSIFDAIDEILTRGSWIKLQVSEPDEPFLTRFEIAFLNFLETSLDGEKDTAHREALFFVRPLFVERFVSLIAQAAFICSQRPNDEFSALVAVE